MESVNFWRQSNRIGLFLVLLFALCILWYFVRGAEGELHLQLLRLSYFGFNGMDAASMAAGAVQTYVWGYVFVALWYLVRKV